MLIDANGLQGFGSTREVMSLDGLAGKIGGLGLDVVEIDGHCDAALGQALERRVDGPRVVALRTTKGRGISFMEDRLEWHYLPLDEEHYAKAMLELSLQELREVAAIARAPRGVALPGRAVA